jgi:RHS repeat-associated protein
VTDQLGTPRLIFDKTGALDKTKRHDYLPFGEELAIGTGGRTAAQSYTGDSVRQKFTSKERDNETGLDYFLARYYASLQGRFTSIDPVSLSPERLGDPQQINLYGYVRNNPLYFIDPTGETLTASGDVVEVQKQLSEMLGTEDAAKRISYDADTKKITADLSGIDLSQNEGAALISNLTGSEHVYDFNIGKAVESKAGTVSLVYHDRVGTTMVNLDNNPLDDRGGLKTDDTLPAKGVDAQVGINFDYRRKHTNVELDKKKKPTSNLKLPLEWTVSFHELAEAYAKVDEGTPTYTSSHNRAVEREEKLRVQRPALQQHIGGDSKHVNIDRPR